MIGMKTYVHFLLLQCSLELLMFLLLSSCCLFCASHRCCAIKHNVTKINNWKMLKKLVPKEWENSSRLITIFRFSP
jgi:hypothetical protein